MPRFKKKPVIINAKQFNGNPEELINWVNSMEPPFNYEGLQVMFDYFLITTLEGTMRGELGDWLIRGTAGEYYPCKPDIFEEIYEEVK